MSYIWGYNMLNKELASALDLAMMKANEQRHESLTVEHLLLALLEEQSALLALEACGVNISKLRVELIEYIDKNISVFDDKLFHLIDT